MIMYIYNGFSQTPTRNFTAAGIDFFVPNVTDDSDKALIMKEAIKKSYKITDEDIEHFIEMIDEVADEILQNSLYNNYLNVVHLYYGLNDKERYFIRRDKNKTEADCVKYFVNNVLTFDNEGHPGVICKFSDMLFINSGIKIALEPHTALEFKEKSGKGTQGWTVKAKLVDEDYSGYMHLSMQYLWWDETKGTVFVGDKLTQGVVYTTLTDNAIELSEDEYNKRMENSKRGADGFGSSDVKH